MSTTLIRPSWVVVPGNSGPVGRPGLDVMIEDDHVAEVGERLPAGDQVLDVPGRVLAPGFVNAHTHLGASPLGRGVVEDFDLRGLPFYMAVAPITGLAYAPEFAEEMRCLMQADIVGLVRSGVTCLVNQNAAQPAYLLELLRESGLRAYSGPILPSSPQARGTSDAQGNLVRVPVPPETLRAEIDSAVALHLKYDEGPKGKLRVIVGPASAETCPDEFLVEMARLNGEWGVPLTLHLAQSEHDVAQARRMFGTTSAGHLAEIGILGPNLIAAHGSLMTEGDVQLLRDAGATVAHCATRKAKEAVFSPFHRYVEAGLRVALANDAFNVDFLQEIRAAAMFGKLLTGDSRKPTAAEALHAATESGGEALGRTDIGRIEAGAKADLALINLSGPFVAPVIDPVASLVYYASGGDVEWVWVDGRIVVSERRMTTLDEAAIAKRVDAAAQKLWGEARARGAMRW